MEIFYESMSKNHKKSKIFDVFPSLESRKLCTKIKFKINRLNIY